jgi:hypothetical protein
MVADKFCPLRSVRHFSPSQTAAIAAEFGLSRYVGHFSSPTDTVGIHAVKMNLKRLE